jgi:curli biogenesis system outer membrane secretion channel CsgG
MLPALQLSADAKAVSVLYFQNTAKSADFDWLSKGVADMLITDLTGKVTVVEREDIQKILKEQELALSGIFDEQGAAKIGKLVSAGRIVTGSFIVTQGALRMDAKLVDVETAKVLAAVQSSGDVKTLFDVEKKLALGLLKAMGIDVAGQVAANETGSVDAAKAYYTGINLLDSGDYAKAAAQFKQAAVMDPFYLKPQKSLAEAYQFLKDFKKQRYQSEINDLYAKADAMKRRLSAPKWQVDAESSILECENPAVCTWNLQHALMEIGDLAQEYFEDSETEAAMYREIMNITQQSRTRFKDDPFLPEILYMELFGLQYFEKWDDVMKACEYLMTTYPKYRMMWAIEDFYERALEKKEGKDD